MAIEQRLTKEGGKAGTIYYSCDVCGDVFPEHQVIRYRGRDYGIPCGDAKDIRSLIERQQAQNRSRREGRR